MPTEPLLFLKPTSSYLRPGAGPIEVPPGSKELHHEVELGLVIGKGGRDIAAKDALSHVAGTRTRHARAPDVLRSDSLSNTPLCRSLCLGYALALDMTARDIQGAAKKKGHPWSVAKGWVAFPFVQLPAQPGDTVRLTLLLCYANGVAGRYDTFCPVSRFVELGEVADLENLRQGDPRMLRCRTGAQLGGLAR